MVINNFQVYQQGNWMIESADLLWSTRSYTACYAIPLEYKDAICQTNAEAFLVGFIQYAAKYNEDIYIQGRPVSEELIQNIESRLIPAFNQMGCGSKPIHIISEVCNDVFPERSGATGISLGIDSCYSILNNIPDKIKYVLNVISCSSFDELSEEATQYDWKSANKREFAQYVNCAYIPILTNFYSIIECEYPFAKYSNAQMHTFIHLSAAMLLMNKIDTYYYATGYSDKDFCLNFSYSSHYDLLVSEVIDYDNFKMFTSGGDVTRVQKTEFVAENNYVQKYLDVCLDNTTGTDYKYINCSKCDKCRRTMITLDVIGEIDSFKHVFDLAYYREHRCWYQGELLYSKIIMKDLLAKEIINEMNRRNYRISYMAWWYFIKRGLCNQISKLKRLVKCHE